MRTLAALALIAFLAGCSSPDGGPVTPPMEDGKYVIHLTKANTFQPMDAKVPVGATVVFVNDGGSHDVTADDGSFSSDQDIGRKMVEGEKYERTFSTAGTIAYKCVIHAESTGMKGTILVE